MEIKSFVSKLAKNGQVPLHQVNLKTHDGDFWFLILATKSKMHELVEQLKSQPQLSDFGQVVYSGFGKNPPEYILQKVGEEYNLIMPEAA